MKSRKKKSYLTLFSAGILASQLFVSPVLLAKESPQPDNYSENTNAEQQLDDQDSSAAEDQESQEDVSKEQTEDSTELSSNFSRLLHDMQNVPLITQGTFSVQFSKDSEQSFEQTIIRDENGVWTLLERSFPNTDAQEVANNEGSESISSTPQTDQSETINTNEQKGSVKN